MQTIATSLDGTWIIFRAITGLVFGAIVGSFLANIVVRVGFGSSALLGRSRCDSCKRQLRAVELVPVISYLASRRCRTCQAPIDIRHPAIEAAAAILGATALAVLPGWDGAITALFGWALLLIGALDAEHHWLPDWLTLPLLVAGLGVAAFDIGPVIVDRLIGAVAGFTALSLIAFAYRYARSREGIGGGDPKLFAALGAWLGWQMLPILLLVAGILGLASAVWKRVRGETLSSADQLPLGTYLALAAWPIWILLLAAR